MDIPHTAAFKYFIYDPHSFSTDAVLEMNQAVEEANRTLVVITDPQIQLSKDYPVYTKANKAFFMHDCRGEVYFGYCWPGDSTWIDFFNSEARSYWKSMYRPERFTGSSRIYNFWIDMNEPSVFNAE